MEALGIDELGRQANAFDDAVFATPEIDHFCSSSDWILPAHAAWGHGLRGYIRKGHFGWLALLQLTNREGTRVLLSFDTMWGFSCPLAGPDPLALADEFAALAREREADWNVMLLSGLRPDSRLFADLANRLDPYYELRQGQELRRWVARLDGGLDGFLGRRSRKFRQNARRARRRCEAAGVTIEWDGRPDVRAAFERVLDVEKRSWKGPLGTGLMAADLCEFYRGLSDRLKARGDLRVLFARRDGVDIGYILGGVRGGAYRGFQFSFDRAVADLSLGTWMQLEQIERLCDEGMASYDLGIDMEYKPRWADEPFDTVTLAVSR